MVDKASILYIGGFELPDRNAAAQRVISNGKLLRDLGYEVIYLGISRKSLEVSKQKEIRFFFGFQTYSQGYPSGFFEWMRYAFRFRKYRELIELNPSIKVVICYNLPSGSLYRLKRYCNKRKIKIISDCTEWYIAPQNAGLIKKYVKKLDIFLRMQVLHPSLDGIISISRYLNDYYLNKGANSVLLPPLVDVEDSKWDRVVNGTNRCIQFVYAGSPFSLSNQSFTKDRIDLVIKALAILKAQNIEFKFIIVGISKSDIIKFFPFLEKDIAFLSECIVFKGIINHAEAISLVKESDYSIFLRSEHIVTLAGFPTKFVESISCGIPVLTNKNYNLLEYLVEGETGFWIDLESESTIAEGIRKAIFIKSDTLRFMKNHCYYSKLFDYRKYYSSVTNIL